MLKGEFVSYKRRIYMGILPLVISTILFYLIGTLSNSDEQWMTPVNIAAFLTLAVMVFALVMLLFFPSKIQRVEFIVLNIITLLHFVMLFIYIHFAMYRGGQEYLGGMFYWTPIFYLFVMFVLDNKKEKGKMSAFIYSIFLCIVTTLIVAINFVYFEIVLGVEVSFTFHHNILQFVTSSISFVFILFGVYKLKKSYLESEIFRNLAMKDGLTGLRNRHFLQENIEKQWKFNQEEPMSFLLFDVDHFKEYNDMYGHMEGDCCLQKISNAVDSVVQNDNAIVARYGGEEFCVVLPKVTLDEAVKVASAVLEAVRSLNIPHENSKIQPYVTVSVGVASMIPTKEKTYEELIDRADQALYFAKRNGKNQLAVYSENYRKDIS
jgi:diguanylate cyclase (GGDEF)-like protein